MDKYIFKKCPVCHGSGYKMESSLGRGILITDRKECWRCRGEGRIDINQLSLHNPNLHLYNGGNQ